MFVAEAGEDLAFAIEARAQAGVGESGPQQLERDAALEQAVGAFGEPDLAHAALAQQPLQPVGADQGAGARAG